MKILTLDIETSPNLADVWSLWNQNVSLNQLRESSRILCVAAKWKESKTINFFSEWGSDDMIGDVYEMLNAADVLVTFNGDRFDIPTLNREFLMAGLGPPEPYISVDLYKVIRRKFRFASNKLDYVCQQLGVGAKTKHEGHGLWTAVMLGDLKARKRMERYCKNDVRIQEKLHDGILGWIPSYPNRSLFTGSECGRCESGTLNKRGFYYTATSRYQTYRCNNCGGYQRDTARIDGITTRGV